MMSMSKSKMMKRILGALIVVVIAVVAVCARGRQQQEKTQEFSPLQKLGYTERLIESFYVDTVDSPKMVEAAIIAMLKTLDPHSVYTDAEETKELTTPLAGNFSGIGIQFNMNNDSLYVIQTTAGGPSEAVGIQPGDRILSANDTIISGAGRSNSEILNILRGPKGTEVLVKVLRRGVTEPITFRIIRDDIPLYSVDAAYMESPTTGYIRVSRFAEDTGNEVAEAVKKLKKEGMKDLIIDLEDNGGGYLNPAFDMASLFLQPGDLVVYTDGARVPRQDYKVKGKPLMPEGRLVVMVNQNSASASEIFAGAIQDNDRGLIVGRRTFGKGLVQRPFPFPDGSMVRLTVSRYHTPTGRSIQKPYVKGEGDDYHMDLYNRYMSGEFMSADSIHFADSLKVETLKNHRVVYGGGGIMPDLFVPIDTTMYSDYYRDLMANGIFNRYAVEYVDLHRDEIKRNYQTESDFVKNFSFTPEMVDALVALGEKNGVKFNEKGLERSRDIICAVTKGLIARDVWDMNGYFRSVNPVSRGTYEKALELVNDKELYDRLITGSGKA